MPPGAPPAAWYILVMIGLQTPSTSFCFTHVGHASWCTSSCLVHLGDDRVANTLHLLLFVLELLDLCQLVGVQPLDGLVTLDNNLFLLILADLVLDLLVFNGSLHVETVRLQVVLSRDPLFLFLVVILELLRVVHHPLDLFLRQPSLV